MKNLKMGFLINRDKHTESMKPILLGILARTVFFPDGKTLLEKWETEIKSSIEIKHTTEITTIEDESYKWSCTTFGDIKFQLTGHFRPSIANSPTVMNTDDDSSIIITKINGSGETYDEVISYGNNDNIDQYRFVIPIPTEFANGRTTNMVNAAINITESLESHFLQLNTLHTIASEYRNGHLFIYVNHFRGVDNVDMSELPYITEDFSISIDGLFIN